MRLIIQEPTARESCYEYRVGTPVGITHAAQLTYRLTGEDAPARDLLLLRRDAQNRLGDLLDDVTNEQLESFEELIRVRAASQGAIGAQKNIVNCIYQGELPLAGLQVVVHRLGPVAVLVLPFTVEVPILGGPARRGRVQAQIGIYPSVRGSAENHWPSFYGNRREFLESLERDLPTIMRRYQEDVAERLFDIQHHQSYQEIAVSCRAILSEIRESIDTKLQDILGRQRYEKHDAAAAAVARRIENKYRETLHVVLCFKACVRLLLGRLLRMLGVRDEVDGFRADLNKVVAQVEGAGETRVDAPVELDQLVKLATTLLDSGESLIDPSQVDSSPPWLIELHSFGGFVGALERDGFVGNDVTIFLAGQHRVPSAATLRQLLVGRFGRAIQYVEKPPDATFLQAITTRIWQSEGIAVVLPRGQRDSEPATEKDFAWLVREADYAEGLGKGVSSLVEKGQNPSDLLRVIEGTASEPLVAGTRRRIGRPRIADALREALVSKVPFSYALDSAGELDLNLEDSLRSLFRNAHAKRAERLLRAAVNFVVKDAREVYAIRKIHEITSRAPLSGAELASKAFPGMSGKRARENFGNLRRRVRERPVVLSGHSMTLFESVPGTKKYKSNLLEIVQGSRLDVDAGALPSVIARALA